jgi:hypothetical protein
MPVPYDQRRRRRQQLVEGLPPGLRGRIALRHVETVAKFSPLVQRRLVEAIAADVRVPAAIQFLKENPSATVDEIISRSQKTTNQCRQIARPGNQEPSNRNDLILLADLLQTCFPDMPRATAEAMAGSALLSEVLGIVCAQRICFGSHHAQSDFVIVVLCGLALSTIEQLKQIIPKRTIYYQALQQSGVEWPF